MLKISFFFPTLQVSAALGLGVLLSGADSSASPMQSGGLIVLPEPQLHLTDRNQADYEFGRANSLDTAQIEHTFTLRNDTGDPLTITQLQPSCHCTTVSVQKNAGVEPDLTGDLIEVPPGQEIAFKVTVQLARQPSGSLSQGVYIFVQGFAGPVARLHLTGELTTGVSITPATLDFGRMKPGEARSRKITVTVDPRLIAGDTLPPLASHLDIEPGTETATTLEIVPEPSASPAEPVSAQRIKTYLVTLRPAKAGNQFARLFFPPLDPAKYKGSVPCETAQEIFSRIAVPVSAQVTE